MFSLFIFSFRSFAECKFTASNFKFHNASGIIDWDSKTDKMVQVFPEIEYFGPELPDKIKATIQLTGSCQKETQLELRIYGYRAVYRMMGGEMEHSQHGAIPEGAWTQALSVIQLKHEAFNNESSIQLNDIDMKKIWSSVDEFFWYWRINYKLFLIDGGQEQEIGERMIPSPLIH